MGFLPKMMTPEWDVRKRREAADTEQRWACNEEPHGVVCMALQKWDSALGFAKWTLWFAGVHFESCAFQMSAFHWAECEIPEQAACLWECCESFQGVCWDFSRCLEVLVLWDLFKSIRKAKAEEQLAGRARFEV